MVKLSHEPVAIFLPISKKPLKLLITIQRDLRITPIKKYTWNVRDYHHEST